MSKVIPTHEQVKIIEQHGLRYDDIQMGPNDGEVTIKDDWKEGREDRWLIIDREGEFRVVYKAPVITF